MDIIKVIDEHLEKNLYNTSFFQLYPFATENINGYIPFFDLKDKSLLTVGSSLDQAINASLEGSNDITVCDICPLTKYFYYLKLSALLNLNRESFLNFLCKRSGLDNNKKYLSKKTFDKIKKTLKSLNYESYYVWDYLFNNHNENDIEKLFRKDANSLESVIYCNKYLNNDYIYNKAKKTILNTLVSFINEDIIILSSNNKYDNIWLSNVAHYLSDDEICDMVDVAINLLKTNGKNLLCYFWNNDKNITGFPIEKLSKYEINKIKVPGISKTDGKNSILVYTKK